MDFLWARRDLAAVAGRSAGGETIKEVNQNLRSHPMRCEWQIQKKLIAKVRGRARSRLAEWVAGWLAEWLGVRAMAIMGIEAGLSNQNFCSDWLCRCLDRDRSLARQNTLKMIVQKRLDGLDVKTAPPCYRHELADCLFVHAAASGRKTPANTG
jgi:hypothetical protein